MLVQKYQWRWTPPHLFRGQRSERWLFGLWRLSSRVARWPTGALPSAYSWSVKINGNQQKHRETHIWGQTLLSKDNLYTCKCHYHSTIPESLSTADAVCEKVSLIERLLVNSISLWILFGWYSIYSHGGRISGMHCFNKARWQSSLVSWRWTVVFFGFCFRELTFRSRTVSFWMIFGVQRWLLESLGNWLWEGFLWEQLY